MGRIRRAFAGARSPGGTTHGLARTGSSADHDVGEAAELGTAGAGQPAAPAGGTEPAADGAGSFGMAWRRIEAHAGEEFQTKTGLPFTYQVTGTSVVPDRTGYPLHASNFRAAFELLPLKGPGEINTLV